MVSQTGSNGVTLAKTSNVGMETIVASTWYENSSKSKEKTAIIGTTFTVRTTTAITKTVSSIDHISDVNGVKTKSVLSGTISPQSIHSESIYTLQENANSGYKSQIGNSLLSMIVLYVFFII